MSRDCFEKYGRIDLADRFDDLIKKGMSDKEASRQLVVEEHKKLFDKLNDFKKGIGVKKQEYKSEDISPKLKSINDTHDKLVDEQNKLKEQQDKDNVIKEQERIKKEEEDKNKKELQDHINDLQGSYDRLSEGLTPEQIKEDDELQRLKNRIDELSGVDKSKEKETEPSKEPPITPPLDPSEQGLHPRDNEWVSIQKKDLSERVQKENAFTQTNRETVDKVIDRLSRDAANNGRTWQSQAEYEVNSLHSEFFNDDGSIKQAFNPTTEQLALIGMRLMDINSQAESSFNPNDVNDIATNEYLDTQQQKAERLLSFGEAGRAFQFRQTLLKMGVGGKVEIMRKKLSSVIDGGIPKNEEEFNQLSDYQKQKIKPLYDAFQDWKTAYEKENRGLNANNEKYSQEEFEKRIKAEVDKRVKAQKESKEPKLSIEKKKEFADKLRTFADKFEKLGRADLPEGTQRQGVDFQRAVANAIRYIAEKIEHGRIPDLIADAIAKFGGEGVDEKELRDKIGEGLKEAGIDEKTIGAPTKREGIVSKMKDIAKNEGVDTLTKEMVNKGLVRDYLHDIVNRGIVEPKDVLEQGAKELSKVFPGTDVKRLRDAYLKEGYFSPDKSIELKEVAKKATETLRSVTRLEKDIEALKIGQDISTADKDHKNVIISDYEKGLREEKQGLIDEKNKLQKELSESTGANKLLGKEQEGVERQLTEYTKKQERLAEIDKKISDLETHGKVWERAKKGDRSVDKELAQKNELLRKTLIKNGVKLESGSKESRAAKEKVIESHNDRVDALSKKVSDLLNDENISDTDKKALQPIRDTLDKLRVSSDVSDLSTKIDRAIASTDKLFKDNITKLIGGEKADVLKDLKQLSKQLGKDNKSALQDIQLSQLKQREVSRKEQAERDLAAGKFDDTPKLSEFTKDTELLGLTKNRKLAERELLYEADKYRRQNQGFWQRQLTRMQRLQRANLISGIMTNGKVLVSGVVKPVTDSGVRGTIGRLTIPLFKSFGLTGEREVLNSKASMNGFVDSFKGMTIKRAAEIRGNANADLDKSITNFQEANDHLLSLEKDSPEYQKYKDNEYTKAENSYKEAQLNWAASMMYDFISPRAWGERLHILKTGTSRFEESMGGIKGRTWADEKSVHGIGTAFNKVIHSLEIFGRIHGVMKDPSARQAFTEGYLKRATTAIENGEQLVPSKLEGFALQSYNDFLGGKFQDKNELSEWIREKQSELSKGGIGKQIASAFIGFSTPVLKIPLNIEYEGLVKYSPLGLSYAVGKTFWEVGKALKMNDISIKEGMSDFNGTMQAIKNHMRELPPATRDKIIEYSNKGAIGTAISLIAGHLASTGALVFGGVYNQGRYQKKRTFYNVDTGREEELNYGEIALNGHKLGKFWSAVVMHLPPLMPAVMSAVYVQKYKDERGGVKYNKYDTPKDQGQASFDALAEVLRVGWEESALKSIGDVASSPTNIFNSFTTQMAAKNISEYFDTDSEGKLIPRKGENVLQDILIRTGGRKFAPTTQQYGVDIMNQKSDRYREAEELRQNDPYYKNK